MCFCSVGGWNNYVSQCHQVSLVLCGTTENLQPVDMLATRFGGGGGGGRGWIKKEAPLLRSLFAACYFCGGFVFCAEGNRCYLLRGLAFVRGLKVNLLVRLV